MISAISQKISIPQEANRDSFFINKKKPNELSNSSPDTKIFGLNNFNDISILPSSNIKIQPKLKINSPEDKFEQEADKVANQVMRMPDQSVQRECQKCGKKEKIQRNLGMSIQRNCANCEKEEELIQTKSNGSNTEASSSLMNQIQNTKGGGQVMDKNTKTFMESRFGVDFNHVRVHNNNSAADMSRGINARAFTKGSDIYFNRGEYSPQSFSGKKLIAHELTHVLQQGSSIFSPNIQRQGLGSGMDDADLAAERAYGNSGAPKAKKCGRPSHCPAGFCSPYRSAKLAEYYRAKKSPWIMLGIKAAVDSKVLPLWKDYLNGGSSTKNLTSKFGKDFTNSPTTKKTTLFLHQELKKKLAVSPPNVPKLTSVSINIGSEIPKAISELGSATSKNRMNFNIPKDIPGNIAGGLGKNQKSCPSGAKPSPFNDNRTASGFASAERIGSNIKITPMIDFKIKDTIDLCPGDCGTTLEQIATIPLSQFEATGISGDVPFTVDFPAPSLGSFTIPAPLP